MMDSLTLKHKVESGNPHARLPAIGFHDPIESRLPLHLEPHREPISSSQLDAHDIRLCSAMRSVRRRWRGAAFVDVARDLEPVPRYVSSRNIATEVRTYTAAETRLVNWEILALPIVAGSDTEHSTKSSPSGTWMMDLIDMI